MKMKRLMVLALLLIMAWSITALAATPPTDDLYAKLHKKALTNLHNLPSATRADYLKLLKQHPDRVMAFLLAYEESGRLAQADPEWVENHWRSVTELQALRGIKQPDEFFLSYVAKCTVSDEPISNYRLALEGSTISALDTATQNTTIKQHIERTSDPLELYRLAQLKTNELLLYKPTSGRDLSPLDVAEKCLVGRCEEWQILFVAVCRTLGLPARPASTPWWAHQDDNHAWAEIYINGSWHYDGDYFPDQNWFTGLTDKMVVIVADGTLPAADDEILSQDEYGATVNSIKHYARERTRSLTIQVLDNKGKPVAKCPIAIDVYNYFSIRPQAYTYTDSLGNKTLTVGQGAFYLMAFKDSLSAIQFVPSSTEKDMVFTMTLSPEPLPAQSVQMEYPNRRVTFEQSPPIWNEQNAAAKKAWQTKLDYIDTKTKSKYFYLGFMQGVNGSKRGGEPTDSDRERAVALSNDSLFTQVLSKSRYNCVQFMPLDLDSTNPAVHPWLATLLENDEKDLWQGSTRLFGRMFRWYQYIQPQTTYLPRAEFLNLLDPTIFYENLPWMSNQAQESGKEMLYPTAMILRKPISPTPQQVYKFFDKKHKIKVEKALIGLLPLDVALSQKNLTGYSYKILACGYMRANQIPANYTRIPSVISVYADSTWKYFDLSKGDYYDAGKTESKKAVAKTEPVATRKVSFSCVDELEQPLQLNKDQIQICFLKDGQFFPTNEQPDYLSNGRFEVELPGSGMFYAQVGYRSSDSLTVYFLRPLTVDKQPVDNISLQCPRYKRIWLQAEDYLLPVTTELDSQGINYAILGNYTLENTLRMATNLQTAGKKFAVIGYQEGRTTAFDYSVQPAALELAKQLPSLQSRTITLLKDAKSGKWQMYEGLWDKLPE